MRMHTALSRIAVGCLTLALTLAAAACGGGDNANTSNTASRNASSNTNAANSNTAVVTGTPAVISGSTNSSTNSSAGSSEDTALRNKTEANLSEAGITGVTVEVSQGVVTLKGDVPSAKFQDAVKAANEAGAKRVQNQLNRK